VDAFTLASIIAGAFFADLTLILAWRAWHRRDAVAAPAVDVVAVSDTGDLPNRDRPPRPTMPGFGFPRLGRPACWAALSGSGMALLGLALLWSTPHAIINLLLVTSGLTAFVLALMRLSDPHAAAPLDAASEWLAGKLLIQRWQVGPIAAGLLLSLASRSAAGSRPIAYTRGYAVLWILGICLTVLGFWDFSPSEPRRRFDRTDASILFVLAGVALAARLVHLGSLPAVLRGDEGSVGLAAWEFIAGARNNVLATAWYNFPSLYFALVSLGQSLFGRTILAIRLPSALAGTAAVLALYLGSKPLFGRATAAAAAGFLSTYDFHVLFSRVALNNIFDTFFLAVILGAFWVAWQGNNRRAFILTGLALGFGVYFYISARLLPVYCLLWLIVLARKGTVRERAPGLLAASATALAVLLPLALFFVEFPNEFVGPFRRVGLFGADWIRITTASTGKTVWQLAVTQLVATLRGLTDSPTLGFYQPGHPMLVGVPVALFVGGLVLSLIRWRDPRYFILLVCLAGPVISGAISVEPPNSQRLLFATPALALLVAIPFGEVESLIARRRPRWTLTAISALLGGIVVLCILELRMLFIDALPSRAYWDHGAEIATRAGPFLAGLRRPLTVYFMDSDAMGFASNPALPYLAANAVGHDLLGSVDPAKIRPSLNTDFVILTLPARASELGVFRSQFPSGTMHLEFDRSGQVLFEMWLVLH
jgi:4-amino-4-deoxy-L-arabinose transferase-like glycosyltransferase